MAALRPVMDDARTFTSYTSSSLYNEVLKKKLELPNATQYRQYLIENGLHAVGTRKKNDLSATPPRKANAVKVFPKTKVNEGTEPVFCPANPSSYKYM